MVPSRVTTSRCQTADKSKHMQDLLTLTQTEFTLLAVICFCAGLVRGFTGFALSAIVMASAALILSPLALIPICWWLELVASAMMVRGGWKDADKGAAVTLWLGSAVAVPIGLYFTQNVSAELSQTVALCLILVLAVTQLANMRLAFLNTRAGLVSAGIGAGIATGLASVGGMVVALYVCHLTVTRAKCVPRWSCSYFWEQLRPLQHYYCLGCWTKSLCCAQRP